MYLTLKKNHNYPDWGGCYYIFILYIKKSRLREGMAEPSETPGVAWAASVMSLLHLPEPTFMTSRMAKGGSTLEQALAGEVAFEMLSE